MWLAVLVPHVTTESCFSKLISSVKQRHDQRKFLAQKSHWSCQIVDTGSWEAALAGGWTSETAPMSTLTRRVRENKGGTDLNVGLREWQPKKRAELSGSVLGKEKKKIIKNNWRLLKMSNIISNYAEKSRAAVIKRQFKILMVKSPFFNSLQAVKQQQPRCLWRKHKNPEMVLKANFFLKDKPRCSTHKMREFLELYYSFCKFKGRLLLLTETCWHSVGAQLCALRWPKTEQTLVSPSAEYHPCRSEGAIRLFLFVFEMTNQRRQLLYPNAVSTSDLTSSAVYYASWLLYFRLNLHNHPDSHTESHLFVFKC